MKLAFLAALAATLLLQSSGLSANENYPNEKYKLK